MKINIKETLLTDEEIKEMFDKFVSGVSSEELAFDYNIARQTVYAYINLYCKRNKLKLVKCYRVERA